MFLTTSHTILLKNEICDKLKGSENFLKDKALITYGTSYSKHTVLNACNTGKALKHWINIVNPEPLDWWFGLLWFNASATARVISRRWNDDDEISFLVEEPGVPGGNHRPTPLDWWEALERYDWVYLLQALVASEASTTDGLGRC